MRIRKFTAPTLAEALAQVKRELGEQAILLKTRPLDPRLDRKKGYEVTAAQDQEPLVSVREPLAPVAAVLPPFRPAGPVNLPQVVSWLAACGVEDLLARRLADAWQKKSHSADPDGLVRLLAALIPIPQTSPKSAQTQVIALVGPTGVGKTTTLAKLAAQFVLIEKKRVRLWTLDTHRIAALEQLDGFGRLLGCPVEMLFDATEIPSCRAGMREEVLLVDTPGVGALDDAGLEQIRRMLQELRPTETHLCLAAGSRSQDLRIAARKFAAVGCDRLLFTKLDETSTAGQLLTALAETRLPVSYWTDGQVVPGDLQKATGEGLARRILEGVAHAQAGVRKSA